MLITIWQNGRRERIEAEPTEFNSARAEEIFQECRERAVCGPYSDMYDKVMTPGEIAYVMQIWNENPNGASSFDSTFQSIRNTK